MQNLIGQKFGKLLVLELIEKNRHGTKYLCKCDCGNEKIVYNYMISSDRIKSCGCYRKQHGRQLGLSRIQWLENKFPDGFSSMYRAYKKGASKRNLEFSIDKETFYKLTQDLCFYCKSEPNQSIYSRSKYTKFIYNGVDRVNNNLGYTIENSVTCCKWCNRAKSTMSIEEFNSWCKRLYQNYIIRL